MKKYFYGITLIIGIISCLVLLFFPVLEFDENAIYLHHQQEIEHAILLDTDLNKSYEEKKNEAINEIIYNTAISLQMYNKTTQVVFDEDGNMISSGSSNELIMYDVYRLKEKGIKFSNILTSIKNQIDWNSSLKSTLKHLNNDMSLYQQLKANPLILIFIASLILIAIICSIILIIQSIKAINEKTTNYLITSIIGTASTLLIIISKFIFKTNLGLEQISKAKEFSLLFSMNTTSSISLMFVFFAFAISIILHFVKNHLKD